MEWFPRMVAAALVGAVVTGAGAWITWGRNIQSRDDVIAIVEQHNPYLEDRKVLELAVTEMGKLRDELIKVRIDLTALRVQLTEYEKRDAKR